MRMKHLMEKADSKTPKKKNEQNVSNLLEKIEQGDIPIQLFLSRLFEMVVELNSKVDKLGQTTLHLSDISRKISEIHSLHFAKDTLEKEKNLTEKFLAEILLGIPRKRKR